MTEQKEPMEIMRYGRWHIYETDDGFTLRSLTWRNHETWNIETHSDDDVTINIRCCLRPGTDQDEYQLKFEGPKEPFKFNRRNSKKSGDWMMRKSRPDRWGYALSVANEKAGIIFLVFKWGSYVYIVDKDYDTILRLYPDGTSKYMKNHPIG